MSLYVFTTDMDFYQGELTKALTTSIDISADTDLGGLSTTVNVTLKVEREIILGLPRRSFVVYPNPASYQINIRHTGGLIPDFWIYDLRGSLLLQGKGTQIDVSQITDQLILLHTCFQGNCNDIKVALKR